MSDFQDQRLLVRTNHYTYCPYEGECAYYSFPIGGVKSECRRLDVRKAISGKGSRQH